MGVHPTAIVDLRATLDGSAEIGPYVVIDGPVAIGPRTRVLAGAYLTGRTEIGADNVIHPGVVLGHEPQDVAYRGAETGLRIGDRNVIREHAEVHRGTEPGTWTEIGDDNYLMSQAHVGHNCRLGSNVIMATGATLGGHVVVEDQAFISGNCVVHQHCRVGLRRAGFDRERMRALATAFRILFRARTNLTAAMARVEAEVRSPDVDHLLAFIRGSRRGVAFGPARAATDDGAEDE